MPDGYCLEYIGPECLNKCCVTVDGCIISTPDIGDCVLCDYSMEGSCETCLLHDPTGERPCNGRHGVYSEEDEDSGREQQ